MVANNRIVNTLFAVIVAALAAVAQPSADLIDTMSGMFNDRVRSLQVSRNGSVMLPPVIDLGGQDWLEISFDVLSDDRDYLRYRLVHCDRNWRPSGLLDSEIVEGFNEGTIDDYAFSRATAVHYVHYNIVVPDGGPMAPLLSGNYLLQVYPEHDPDDVWLQARFMVAEPPAAQAELAAAVTDRTDRGARQTYQQVSVEVDTRHASVDDPYNDLSVVVEQNGRQDNVATVQHPMRMSGRVAVFEHLPELIFPAGNEYRRFEIVSTNYPGMGVERIEWLEPYYHFVLAADDSRAGHQYLYDSTQHGAYLVRQSGASDSNIEADYAVVHFSLDYPEMPGLMIFLDGDMVQRRFGPESLMTYNRATGRYERALLLKQGAYNYQYLVLAPGAQVGRTDVIEGDFYPTVNRYDIRVYNRRRGERYDRLIGYASIFSGQ